MVHELLLVDISFDVCFMNLGIPTLFDLVKFIPGKIICFASVGIILQPYI